MKNMKLVLALMLALPCAMVQASDESQDSQKPSLIGQFLVPYNEHTSRVELFPKELQRTILSFLTAAPFSYTQKDIGSYCRAKELVNKINGSGWTPLHREFYTKNTAIINDNMNMHSMKQMIALGANPYAVAYSYMGAANPFDSAEFIIGAPATSNYRKKYSELYSLFNANERTHLALHPMRSEKIMDDESKAAVAKYNAGI